MGATLVEGGATLRTWAPSALDVYVVTAGQPTSGWSAWTPVPSERLVPLGDGTWAGFVPDLREGDPYLFWVRGAGSEGFKRLVDEEQFGVVGRARGQIKAGVAGAELLQAAAVLLGQLAACAIDEDAAHGLGRGGEKVRAVGPRGLPVAAQPQPRFVDEGRGLQGLAGRFAGHARGGEPAQLIINERQQLVRSRRIALAHRG